MAVTRFHFIAPMPMAGGAVLSAILGQNPRFVTRNDGRAARVFSMFADQIADPDGAAAGLDADQRNALLRGVMDSVYHDRPLDSVIFDSAIDWLNHVDVLARMFPLSRFVVPVRNPAAIVDIAASDAKVDEADVGSLGDELTAPDGQLGRYMNRLRAALAGPQSERFLLVDYDRFTEDAEAVLEIVYDFLREDFFEHDLTPFSDATAPSGLDQLVKLARRDGQGRLEHRLQRNLGNKAFWRNLRRTDATMLLSSGLPANLG